MAACDRCGESVRAFVFVLIGNTELEYCGHCADRFAPTWLERGYLVVADLRERAE